jgi:stress response protein SCP2
MGISLKKGQGVSLKKKDDDLSLVTIGLGWDVKEPKKGLFGSIFAKKEADYDLDVIAFLCEADGKIHNLGDTVDGKPTLKNGDIIFFNSMNHPSGHIWLTGDNRTGAGDGDDEQIIVKLNELSDKYKKIIFIVQIYNAVALGQNFGNVNNAYIRAVNSKNRELARFDLSAGTAFASYRSILFAELDRESDGWKFNALGVPSKEESFVSYIKDYV